MKTAKILSFMVLLALPHRAWATAYAYPNSNTKVAVPDVAALESTAFTDCAWTFRTGAGGGSNGRIIDKSNSAGNTGYLWRTQATVNRFFYIFSTNTGDWQTSVESNSVWHFQCMAYDNSSVNNNPSAWLDGAVNTVTRNIQPTGTATSNNQTYNIGNDPTSVTNWAGRLAGVCHYNRILTTNEVKQIMFRGCPSLSRGLIGYWPLGSFGGANYTNTTGLTGTVTGTPTVDNSGPPVACPQGGLCR